MSIPTRANGKVKNKKVDEDLYVRKCNVNAILNRTKMGSQFEEGRPLPVFQIRAIIAETTPKKLKGERK